jgi:hypothetical protein
MAKEGPMRVKAMGSLLLVLGLLAACGGGAAPAPAEASEGTASEGGTWSGTVTRRWEQDVEQFGEGMESRARQTYEAVAQISSVQVDIGAWELSGSAEIVSTFTSDYQNRMTSSLGPCNAHYTDDAKGQGNVPVEGGLEAGDGFYQFHVNISGLDGANETMRDDSGCRGPNKRETVPWGVAPVTVAQSGDLDDPDHISGSSETREGAKETITWDLKRTTQPAGGAPGAGARPTATVEPGS